MHAYTFIKLHFRFEIRRYPITHHVTQLQRFSSTPADLCSADVYAVPYLLIFPEEHRLTSSVKHGHCLHGPFRDDVRSLPIFQGPCLTSLPLRTSYLPSVMLLRTNAPMSRKTAYEYQLECSCGVRLVIISFGYLLLQENLCKLWLIWGFLPSFGEMRWDLRSTS